MKDSDECYHVLFDCEADPLVSQANAVVISPGLQLLKARHACKVFRHFYTFNDGSDSTEQ